MGAHGCSCVFMTSVHMFLFVFLLPSIFSVKTVGSRKRSLSDGSALGFLKANLESREPQIIGKPRV